MFWVMPWFEVSSIYDLFNFDPSLNDFKYLQIFIRVFKISVNSPFKSTNFKNNPYVSKLVGEQIIKRYLND